MVLYEAMFLRFGKAIICLQESINSPFAVIFWDFCLPADASKGFTFHIIPTSGGIKYYSEALI